MHFILATNNVPAIVTFLVNRGFIRQAADGGYVPNIDGFRWHKIPNPINALDMYGIRFARAANADDDERPDGTADRYTNSKFVKWVVANSTPGTFTWEREGQDPVDIPYRQVNTGGSTRVYLMKADGIHAWQ